MTYRRLALLAGLIVLTLAADVAAQAPPAPARAAAPAASKPWTPPKTPWGDPDLQGTWTSDDCIGTPMQRPVNLGEKMYSDG